MELPEPTPVPLPEPTLAPSRGPVRPGLRPRPRPMQAARFPEPTFGHYVLAAGGSLLIGVTLPSLLTALRLCMLDEFAKDRVLYFFVLQLLATLGCGPGAVILSLILMSFLSLKARMWSAKRAIVTGGLSGIAIAFLNFPGFIVIALLQKHDDGMLATMRALLLFVVAGVTCGMWIGWQTWRGFRPGERFLPRFTMKTMILIVLMWGTVLVAFQPNRYDEMVRMRARLEAEDPHGPNLLPPSNNLAPAAPIPVEPTETVEPPTTDSNKF